VACIADLGISAVVCDSLASANEAIETLAAGNISVPGRVSVAAIGLSDPPYPCSGFFVSSRKMAESILDVVANTQATKPLTLWLATHEVDADTISPVIERGIEQPIIPDLRVSSLAS